MKIGKRDILMIVVAASAAFSALAASRFRKHHQRAAHDREHKSDLKSWENEGGNVAPEVAVPAQR